MTRPSAAEIRTKIATWQAELIADVAQSERMQAEHVALQRSFDAHKLVDHLRSLRGDTFHDFGGEIRHAFETAIPELPEAELTDAGRAQLRHRHEAQALVKFVTDLRGPMTAEAEAQLQQHLELVLKENPHEHQRN
jgi:hypothetical protein